MTPVDTEWMWRADPLAIVAGSVLFFLYVGITLYHLRQVPRTPMRLLTEGVKFLGAILLLLTLFQPEKHTRTARHEHARLAVVVDGTDSMETRDMRVAGEPATRKDWIAALRASDAWSALEEQVELQVSEMGHAEPSARRQTDIRAGLSAARSVENLAAVLVISDGAHNAAASPLPEMLRLAEAGVPAYAIEVGQPERLPDLVLENVDFPSYSIMNEALVLPARVTSTLTEDASVRVSLLDGSRTVDTRDVRIPAGKTEDVSLRWIPRRPGPAKLSVRVAAHPEERFEDNNSRSATVDIRRTTIQVLLIDSLPRWEFRYLRNALRRDPGVEVDSLLIHPELGPQAGPGYLESFPVSRDAWSAYDVVFLGDVGLGEGELSPEDLRNLDVLVREQGSGLVFLPGPRGGHLRLAGTPLDSLLPVEYDPSRPEGVGAELEMRPSLTREGREHMLTQLHGSPARNLRIWNQLPGFHWFAAVTRPRVGSEVLATHGSRRNAHGRIPLLATREAGAGHVLFLGTDGAWRWRKGVEDLYHYRFWGQVVRWMAHKRHMFSDDGARVFLQPERPEVGREVTATVSLRGGRALRDGVPFRLRLTNAAGDVTSPAVDSLEGGGTYRTSWTPETPGETTLDLLPEEGGDTPWFSATFRVEGEIPEQRGTPLQPALLRELARITEGESVGASEAGDLLARLARVPREQRVLHVDRIWQHPAWIVSVFVFFAIYWILRKRQGWI